MTAVSCSTIWTPRWHSVEARCDLVHPSPLHRPSDVDIPRRHHFSKCPMSPVTASLRYCRIVRTLRSTADGASVAAEGDDLLLLLDVLKELDGALQLPAVDGLGGLAGVLERNSEVGTAGLGRLGGRDLGGSVANLWVERVNVTISTAASPLQSFPLPPSQPSAAREFPRFRQPGALGAIGNSLVLGLGKSVCTHHLDGVDVEMVSSSSLGVDGRLRVWLAGKVFAGLGRAAPSQSDCGQSPVKSFCAPANHECRFCPASRRAPLGARRGYLGTGPTLVLKFFQLFLLAAKALWVGLTSCNHCNTRHRLTLPRALNSCPVAVTQRSNRSLRLHFFKHSTTKSELPFSMGFAPRGRGGGGDRGGRGGGFRGGGDRGRGGGRGGGGFRGKLSGVLVATS